MTRDRAWIAGSALLVLAIGLVAGGRGYLNGDAAAYAAQGWSADLGQRVVHLGWLLVAAALAPIADESLPAWLDAVHAGFATLAVVATAAWAARAGGRPALGAIGCAVAVLPWSPFAEVDVPWVALAVSAITLPAPASAVLVGLAVSLSPSAILATPWIAVARARLDPNTPRERSYAPVAVGLLVAVLALSLYSGGAWWSGDRGVLTAANPTPGRSILQWAAEIPLGLLPLVLLARGWALIALATVPMLLAPADTPSVLPLALTIAMAASLGWHNLPLGRGLQIAVIVLGVQVAQRCLATGFAALQVSAQDAVIRSVADELGPRDGLVAPFSWGARLGVIATGDPYGRRWRPPDGPLRSQGAAWCATPVERVAVLPPGAILGEGAADARGVWWTRGDDPAFARWCVAPETGS